MAVQQPRSFWHVLSWSDTATNGMQWIANTYWTPTLQERNSRGGIWLEQVERNNKSENQFWGAWSWWWSRLEFSDKTDLWKGLAEKGPPLSSCRLTTPIFSFGWWPGSISAIKTHFVEIARGNLRSFFFVLLWMAQLRSFLMRFLLLVFTVFSAVCTLAIISTFALNFSSLTINQISELSHGNPSTNIMLFLMLQKNVYTKYLCTKWY